MFAETSLNDGLGRNIRDGFDAQFYLAQNPDVAAAGVDARMHYNTWGWREGRDPNSVFDTSGYLAANPDVRAAGVNPLEHYHNYGWKEGRDPNVTFDSQSYLSRFAWFGQPMRPVIPCADLGRGMEHSRQVACGCG